MADDPSEGLAQFRTGLAEARAALTAFARGPAQEAASTLETSMTRAGQTMARELDRAAKSGELSFKRLAKVALEELAKIALDRALPQPQSKSSSGLLEAAASALTVNFHLGAGADADSIRRSQAQIAAQVAKAAAYGRRNL